MERRLGGRLIGGVGSSARPAGGGALFELAYQSHVPSLVERRFLVEGNAKLQTSAAAAEVGGPGVAGLLIQVVTAPVAVLVDAISFLVSALAIASIRKPEPKPEARERHPDAGGLLRRLPASRATNRPQDPVSPPLPSGRWLSRVRTLGARPTPSLRPGAGSGSPNRVTIGMTPSQVSRSSSSGSP